MFIVKSIKFGHLEAVKLENLETGEYLLVVPQYGANLYDLVLQKNGKSYSVIKGFWDAECMEIHHGHYTAHLFPFAGRIPDGSFIYNDKEHVFEITDDLYNCALHGFLYNQPMELVEQIASDDIGKLTFAMSTKNVHDGYPYDVVIKITYTLDESGFTCKTQFQNNGEDTSPFSYGVHPYYRIGSKIDDLEIKIQSSKETILNDRLVPSGTTKENSDFLEFKSIKEIDFDNGFVLPQSDGVVTTQLRNNHENATLNIWQETGKNKFNFLQIYTPPYRDCIAIEPLCGNLNSLTSGDQLVELKAGETIDMKWGVKLS